MLFETLPIRIWTEGPRFLAKCLATGTVSEGACQEEALERLRKGVALYGKRGSAFILKPAGPVTQGP